MEINNFAKGLLAALTLSASGAAFCGEDFIIGVTAHFPKGRIISVSEHLKGIKEAGIASTRGDTCWSAWEQEKGVYSSPGARFSEYIDKATAEGIAPLQILDYGNKLYDGGGYPKSPEAIEGFAKFCEQVVRTYKGRCHLYQLWNEWDGGCGMDNFRGQGDAVSYVKLAKAVYPRLKAIDPSITIIANSVCTGEKFFEDTLKEGLIKYCDGLAFHAYHYNKSGEAKMPEAYAARIAKLDEMVKSYNGGKSFPIYLTETGWPNHIKNGGSSDSETGDYIARAYLLLKSIPAVKGLWWYNFENGGLDPEYNESNFGMVRGDMTPKDAYYVLRSISGIVKDAKFAGRMKSPDDALIALKFKMPDGKDVIAAWTTTPDLNMQVTLRKPNGTRGELETFIAGFDRLKRDWGAREWVGFRNQLTKPDAPFMPDSFQFTVRGRPYVLIGELSGVEIEKTSKIEFPQRSGGGACAIKLPSKIAFIHPSSKKTEPVDFGGAKNYRSFRGGAPLPKGDLDAKFSLSYEKDALTLVVEVKDDKFSNDESGVSIWRGDSVQVAFQDLASENVKNGMSEYTLALTKNGPEVYRHFSQAKLPEGDAKDVKVDVKRDGANCVYTAKFPLKELGMKAPLEPENAFGFSILVNDNDADGRKGYLHWADGIGNAKDPSDFGGIVVKE